MLAEAPSECAQRLRRVSTSALVARVDDCFIRQQVPEMRELSNRFSLESGEQHTLRRHASHYGGHSFESIRDTLCQKSRPKGLQGQRGLAALGKTFPRTPQQVKCRGEPTARALCCRCGNESTRKAPGGLLLLSCCQFRSLSSTLTPNLHSSITSSKYTPYWTIFPRGWEYRAVISSVYHNSAIYSY